MGGIPMRRVLLATLAICLPGRETGQVAPPLPDLAAMAAHEGRSRPALGPRGTPLGGAAGRLCTARTRPLLCPLAPVLGALAGIGLGVRCGTGEVASRAPLTRWRTLPRAGAVAPSDPFPYTAPFLRPVGIGGT
ncbi:hypothetical protein GCM10011504_12150 [Siccirubricoccus deserti]|nr:hypothetical protein GCM10011504_12150 [Siccirubricoccus deserti]